MGKHLLAFGEVMMRLQVPRHLKLEQSDSLHYSFSGTGVNIAAAVSGLGHHASLLTVLPDNPIGDAAIASIKKFGINCHSIIRSGEYVGMYFLEDGFDHRPSRVTYTNRKESSFNRSDIDVYHDADLSNIDMVHFCGITLAMNDIVREQMKQLAEQVKRQGGKVIFDCNYRPKHWGESGYKKAKQHYMDMLKHADIVLMNEKDAIHILGMETTKEDRLEQVTELIPIIAEKYDIAVIAGTHRTIHDDGTHTIHGYLYKDGRFTFSRPKHFQVLDRIGAGDAFASGIIHGLLTELEAEKHIEFAVTAGAYAHTIIGDTPIFSVKEIEKAMHDTHSDIER